MSLVRLDHIIFTVPDIEESHSKLGDRFPEAWPIGRFWPYGRTSGIALGGINLELLQPDEEAPPKEHGYALAFEPSSLDEAVDMFRSAGLGDRVEAKIESDHDLLRLRGFSELDSRRSQEICRNLLPANPQNLPVSFFVCSYSPFLRSFLAPTNPRVATSERVKALVYGTPEPAAAEALLKRLGYVGDIPIEFTYDERRRILHVILESGPLPWP